MKLKATYLGLCVLGTALPGSQLALFLREHGLDLRRFVEQLFANPVGGFFGLDVIVSSVALWVLVFADGRRAGVRHLWAPIAANLVVGVSLGLPLFLYARTAAWPERPGGSQPAGPRAERGNCPADRPRPFAGTDRR